MLRYALNMVWQTRLPCAWLSSSHHAYGSAAWPLRPQIKDGVVLEYTTSSTSSDQQSGNLPHWSSAVMKVLLVQPSSAAAERVFSILNSSFDDSQEHALVDYLQACVMLQYNNR